LTWKGIPWRQEFFTEEVLGVSEPVRNSSRTLILTEEIAMKISLSKN
jgi:hypothetical protein